ncbi:hypothetical protein SAMN04487981_106395 [Streptomyces sp. cf386]|uniref:hypothetical protein n=1 Tax=Streptomyces sp. cf386 TaxID=1761904 RepID=UPI00088CDE23|nr:hypothetical protein [Streptomyces sp. cf386]SDN75092.1 hypothetical protein SAMN04487981_106395 [Streptomyces sp. cf386]
MTSKAFQVQSWVPDVTWIRRPPGVSPFPRSIFLCWKYGYSAPFATRNTRSELTTTRPSLMRILRFRLRGSVSAASGTTPATTSSISGEVPEVLGVDDGGEGVEEGEGDGEGEGGV